MTEETPERRFATASEVAEYLRISPKTFKRHVAPQLPKIPIGSRFIYDMEEVDGWAEANKIQPVPPRVPRSRALGTRSQRESEIAKQLRSRLK